MHFFEFCQFVMDMDLVAFIDLIDFIDLTERGGRNRLAPTHTPTHVMPQNGRIKKQSLMISFENFQPAGNISPLDDSIKNSDFPKDHKIH